MRTAQQILTRRVKVRAAARQRSGSPPLALGARPGDLEVAQVAERLATATSWRSSASSASP